MSFLATTLFSVITSLLGRQVGWLVILGVIGSVLGGAYYKGFVGGSKHSDKKHTKTIKKLELENVELQTTIYKIKIEARDRENEFNETLRKAREASGPVRTGDKSGRVRNNYKNSPRNCRDCK